MISSRSLYVPETHGLNTETTPETGQEGGEEKSHWIRVLMGHRYSKDRKCGQRVRHLKLGLRW